MKILIKILVSFFLLLFLINMSHEYYTIVRFAIMVCFILLAFYSYNKRVPVQVILYLLLALLFQPFERLVLGRSLWLIVDIFLTVILIVSIFIENYTLTTARFNKRIIAKEILLLIGSGVLVFLFWIFLLLRNELFKSKVQSIENKITKLSTLIDSLPSLNGLWEVYNRVPFYIAFQANNTQFIIPQDAENFFLQDNPDAKKMKTSATGFFEIYQYLHYKFIKTKDNNQRHTYTHGFDPSLIKDDNRSDFMPETIHLPNAEIAMELIDFNGFFRKCVHSEEYRNKLYSVINFQKPAFDSIIRASSLYTNNVRTQRNALIVQRQELEKSIPDIQIKILDGNNTKQRIFIAALIIGLIVYPLRFLVLLGKWSIRTLKSH